MAQYEKSRLLAPMSEQVFNPCSSQDRREGAFAKLTSQYQVSVPKAIADQYRLRPGVDIVWVPAGDVIRVIPPGQTVPAETIDSRLHLFDLVRPWPR
ncbi:MAG: AbrB/MazE/SpoVT family DNA-binding domain-containing protein [Bryobacterales bacterium]|nr:AbrB/MazE/SpoVT family DNA-binding domain-containing protein [Bryobacterales bacterium]